MVVPSLVSTQKPVRFWFRDPDCFGGKVFVAQSFLLLGVLMKMVGAF
jgi:hypothetical protein